MRQMIIYNGRSNRNFGAVVSSKEEYNAPAPRISDFTVPGKNGKLHYTDGTYDNFQKKYRIVVMNGDLATKTKAIKAWLLSDSGYHRFEDTYDTEVYRMARVINSIEFSIFRNMASCDAEFDFKPASFLKSGENTVEFTKSGSILNPTSFAASPLIRIYGKGIVRIGNDEITINRSGKKYIDIDTEISAAFEGIESRNGNISRINKKIVLIPGENQIGLGDGITKVEIKPRWWTL